MLSELREQVCRANRDLATQQLVILTWGNVSGIDREQGIMAIKPSGVSYEKLTPDDMVLVDLDGKVVEGDYKPSSDTPTHLCLYRAFERIGGITHTHSFYATIFAQAQKEIPCYGTTHADHFFGPVPVTRPLTQNQIEENYERNTGVSIVQRFERLDALKMPAVLVASHAPFTWGKDAAESLVNAVALEAVAKMAIETQRLNRDVEPVPHYLLKKHFERKHGPLAYYGQK